MQTVKKGNKGEVVELVQRMLNEKGYACGSADGIFGAKTESAVKSYQ
ncbi:MAG: peptidoglycan-binding protein, partial [Clostridiales bacterium]|nr:peptidoglycan-binding protein [Clostridiales bacterium]